jgi:hypothetical protein
VARFSQGHYKPKNPIKYVGKGSIIYRSSWELAFMNFCDNNNNVLEWSSESIRIPYRNPLTGKHSTYVPDFLVVYQNKHFKQVVELIEIKPKKQSMLTEKLNSNERATVAINYAKWEAAIAWAKRNHIIFRVITEDQIFRK